MTQDKDLLLKYLCAALPYGVVIEYNNDGFVETREMGLGSLHDFMFDNAEVKPYLRSMSSMTEEECKELGELPATINNIGETFPNTPYYIEVARVEQINWLLEHHFDFMGLIEKDLAIEVTESNNPYKD